MADAVELLGEGVRERDPAKIRAAEREFDELAAQAPERADVWFGLATIYHLTGRIARALDALECALEREPSSVAAQLLKAEVLLDTGRAADALPVTGQVLSHDASNQRAHSLRGRAYVELEGWVEGELHLETAVQSAEAELGDVFRLAQCRRQIGKLAGAQALLEKAIASYPGEAPLYAELGQLCARRGEVHGAERAYGMAFARAKDGQTRILIGKLLSRIGCFATAERALREGLRTLGPNQDPHELIAKAHIGNLPAPHCQSDDISELERAVERPACGDKARSLGYSVLARRADRAHHIESAVQHTRAANQHQQAWFEAAGARYSPEHFEQQVDRIIETFDAEYFGRRPQGYTDTKPIFIVGMPRSGTSLVEQILDCHSQVFGAGELRLVLNGKTYLALNQSGSNDFLACIPNLTGETATRWGNAHVDLLEQHAPHSRHVVDKYPDNYLELGWIVTMLPHAKIIACRRDRNDNALSCWLTRMHRVAWSTDLDWIWHRIDQFERLMQHWREVLPTPIHEIHYEQVTGEPEPEVRTLLEHLGLEWEDACLEPHRKKREVSTASSTQVREAIHTKSQGRWERYREFL